MTAKNTKPLSQARDADARHTVAALHRAAHNARQLAAQTHTPLIVVNNTSTVSDVGETVAQAAKQLNDSAKTQARHP